MANNISSTSNNASTEVNRAWFMTNDALAETNNASTEANQARFMTNDALIETNNAPFISTILQLKQTELD